MPEELSLAEQAQQVAEGSARFTEQFKRACAEIKLFHHEAVLAALAECRSEGEGIIHGNEAIDRLHQNYIASQRLLWQGQLASVLLLQAETLANLGRLEDAGQTIDEARLLIAAFPWGGLYEGKIYQIEALIAERENRNPLEKYDAAISSFQGIRAWLAAVEACQNAGVWACNNYQYQAYEKYMQTALDLCQQGALPALALSLKLSKAFHDFYAANTSGALEVIRQQIDYIKGLGLRKILADDWNALHADACAAFASASAALTEALDGVREGRPVASPQDFVTALERARPHAEAFGFSELLSIAAQQVHSVPPSPESLASALETMRDCERQVEEAYAALLVDALIFVAELKNKLDDGYDAYGALDEAEQVAAVNPKKLAQVWMSRAGVLETDGFLPDRGQCAIAAAEKAVELSRDLPAFQREQAELLLCRLRPPVQLPDITEDQGQIAIGQATEHFQAKRFEEALRVLDSALAAAREPHLRRRLLDWRIITCVEWGHFAEAAGDADESLQLLSLDAAADRSAASEDIRQRIEEEENLCVLKAIAEFKQGHTEEAWRAAEQGRAGILKRDLGGIPDGAEFEEYRSRLAADGAAILCIGQAMRWGRLVLSACPGDANPQATLLQKFDYLSDSNSLLDQLPKLSAALIHPIEERIREITRNCRVLYLVPASDLFPVPWAGLTTQDGQALVELCPVAVAPSVAVLLWCAAHRPSTLKHSLLAAGVEVKKKYNFSQQAEMIAALSWPEAPTLLLDDEATAPRVAQEAQRHSVIFLAAHGAFYEDNQDPLAASVIKLADGDLCAREVLHWNLNAELIFMNACQSALFRTVGWTQVNGLVRAFIAAGARAIIATQEKVDPGEAAELAETFFRSWLSGATKAEALRTAQLALKKAGAEAKDWAAYCLIGDFV